MLCLRFGIVIKHFQLRKSLIDLLWLWKGSQEQMPLLNPVHFSLKSKDFLKLPIYELISCICESHWKIFFVSRSVSTIEKISTLVCSSYTPFVTFRSDLKKNFYFILFVEITFWLVLSINLIISYSKALIFFRLREATPSLYLRQYPRVCSPLTYFLTWYIVCAPP